MTRINDFRPSKALDFLVWGKQNANALFFAAVLIICSVTVGCSKEQPKPVSSNNQIPVTQPPIPVQPAPVMQAESKPAPKKVVRKKPATVNYTDKTYGVTFEYPRRYAIETGNAATELIEANPLPMNFVEPGGTALAVVELPETSFANTDFSFGFFNVSVHKTLTADQCNQFAVPQPKVDVARALLPASVDSATQASGADPKPEVTAVTQDSAKPAASTPTESAKTEGKPVTTASDPKPATVASDASTTQPEPQGSKLLLGDMELRATEAVSGEGARQSDSKYFHVYQNGACYEFAMNVTTVASSDGLIKHVDRDKVFNRLEQILSTVKINPITATPEVTAEAPAPTPVPATPAQ